MTSRFKVLLGLLLLFAAGIGTGILLAPHLQAGHKASAFRVAEWIDQTAAEYRTRLDLDAGEETLVHAAISAAGQSIVRERSEAQHRLQSVVKAMNADLLATLDLTSQQRLQKLLEEKRAKVETRPGH